MQGFFTAQDIEIKKPLCPTNTRLCGKCRLYKHCKSPKMPPTGQGRKRILVLGEFPSFEDDKRNMQFVGERGQLLKQHLEELGIDLVRDCWSYNAVNCRPPKMTAHDREIYSCRSSVFKFIQSVKPKLIICLGAVPIRSLLGHRLYSSPGHLEKWVGMTIPDQDLGCWVSFNYSPFLLLSNNKKNKAMDVLFHSYLREALLHRKKPLPQYDLFELQKKVLILTEEDRICSAIEKMRRASKLVTVDFECSGLKPERKGHFLYTCALCNSVEKAISFPISPLRSKKVKKTLARLLADPVVPKSAANMKYEIRWCLHFLNTDISNLCWDPVLAAHIIDNRTGITSVKHQVYQYLGIADYSSSISPFLKSEYANDQNRIKEAPLRDVLLYGGMDGLLEHLISKIQMKKFGIGRLFNRPDALTKEMKQDQWFL